MILTNKSEFIEFSNNMVSVSGNFIDISIPSHWISHCKDCNICDKFYDRIKTVSFDDWFIKINQSWFKMDFLNLNQIGNGNKIFLSGTSPGWFILDDIELITLSKSEVTSINRSFNIDCLGI